MTVWEFLGAWAFLLVGFVLVMWRAGAVMRRHDTQCPPHVWERASMGDHPDAEYICAQCGRELHFPVT